MVDLSKFVSNNKLLSDVISLKVTLGVTWIQLYIYIYNSIVIFFFFFENV